MNMTRKYRRFAILVGLLVGSTSIMAQNPFQGLEHLFTTPAGYIAGFTASSPVVDGDVTEKTWQQAKWSNDFQDIEGNLKPKPAFQTRMKMLWNDSILFIAAEMKEPQVWATLRKHDEIVFHDNDFEIFIDPDNNTHEYYEIEVNAFNTIFDLFMPKPYRNQSGAMINWDLPGLRSRVRIQGTLNKPLDKDSSWTMEMAITFRALLPGGGGARPADGETWRINFSRVEWDTEVKQGKYSKTKDSLGRGRPEHNWVWSPQGVVNMHFPERWGYLQFSRNTNPASLVFEMPYTEKQKNYLWLCYYRQKEYAGLHKKYAASLTELGIDSAGIIVDTHLNKLQMEATSRQFTVTITDENNSAASINEDGLIRYLKIR
jgi:hypothetical protein